MWNNVQAMRRVSGWLYFAVFVMLIGAAAVWLYRSPYFPIKKVNIDGSLQYADGAELQQIARRYIRGNIFRADLNGAQAAFSRMPWIASAEVRRRLPDTVDIRLTERVPVAHWDENRLVDSEGEVFRAAVDEDTDLPRFRGQAGAGKTMVEHLAMFRRDLAGQKLGIAVLSYTPRSAWEIELDNGVTVRLGREQERERLRRFAKAWPELLAAQADRLDYVDMRYKDGFAVRLKKAEHSEDAAERPSEND